MVWTEAGLINELALIRGYRTYLEICTPTTGGLYAAVDRTRYMCHRLMYRYPAKFMDKLVYMARFEDKMSIDFRTLQLDIADCVQAMQARGLKYDVILVDSFHIYRESARDIAVAVDRLSPGGTIVAHDCFPRDSTLAVPNFIRGGAA
jgi:hypothetical protein